MQPRTLITSLLALSLPMGIGVACGDDDGGNNSGGSNQQDTGSTRDVDNGERDVGQTDAGRMDTGQMDATPSDVPDSGEPDTGSPGISFSGTVRVHPAVSTINSDFDLTGSQITLLPAQTALMGGEVQPAEKTDGSPAVVSLSGASGQQEVEWSISNVDDNEFGVAATGIVDDADGSSEDRFIRAVTGIAATGDLEEENPGSVLYAIDNQTEETFANLVADELGDYDTGAGELIETGFILFRVVDSDGEPVEDAQIQEGGSDLQNIVYPSPDFQSAESGSSASTSAAGLAIVPDFDATLPPTFSVSKSGMSFQEQRAAGPDGYAFVVTLQQTDASN